MSTLLPPVTLVTPTGGRPEAFALCERWMQRQGYRGNIRWIIIDDADPATSCTRGQTVLRPEPRWEPHKSMMTQARNLALAMEQDLDDFLLFIEDDDWYRADYIERMVERLQDCHVAGLHGSRYYHLSARQYLVNEDAQHSCLCQVGLRREAYPLFQAICQKWRYYLDVEFFKAAWQTLQVRIDSHDGSVVGIKGMPGRPGAGIGHDTRRCTGWKHDRDNRKLTEWLGEDTAAYHRYQNQ